MSVNGLFDKRNVVNGDDLFAVGKNHVHGKVHSRALPPEACVILAGTKKFLHTST